MHRTCRTRSEEMGSFLFHGNCLEEKPDADTQVSSVFGIGCEDVNFVFPDPRGRSGELIIFCRPTARPGYQGGRGREPGKAGRAQPGQAKPGQTEPGQAGPSPWGPSRAGPSPLEPNRAGPSPWGPRRAVPCPPPPRCAPQRASPRSPAPRARTRGRASLPTRVRVCHGQPLVHAPWLRPRVPARACSAVRSRPAAAHARANVRVRGRARTRGGLVPAHTLGVQRGGARGHGRERARVCGAGRCGHEDARVPVRASRCGRAQVRAHTRGHKRAHRRTVSAHGCAHRSPHGPEPKVGAGWRGGAGGWGGVSPRSLALCPFKTGTPRGCAHGHARGGRARVRAPAPGPSPALPITRRPL